MTKFQPGGGGETRGGGGDSAGGGGLRTDETKNGHVSTKRLRSSSCQKLLYF